METSKIEQLRQGDIFLERVEKPDLSKLIPRNRDAATNKMIVARGEKTGHMHWFEKTQSQIFESSSVCYLLLEEDDVMKHQEHPFLNVPAGTYRMIQQREYSPNEVKRELRVVD